MTCAPAAGPAQVPPSAWSGPPRLVFAAWESWAPPTLGLLQGVVWKSNLNKSCFVSRIWSVSLLFSLKELGGNTILKNRIFLPCNL